MAEERGIDMLSSSLKGRVDANDADKEPIATSKRPSLRPSPLTRRPTQRQKRRQKKKAGTLPFVLRVPNSLSMTMAVRGSPMARKRREAKARSLSKK